MKDKKYILQKDIVIPAGTEFDNYSNKAKENGHFECVIGLHKDYAQFFAITDMEELLSVDSKMFKEVKK